MLVPPFFSRVRGKKADYRLFQPVLAVPAGLYTHYKRNDLHRCLQGRVEAQEMKEVKEER